MQNINSISEFHAKLHLPAPQHPLISVIAIEDIDLKSIYLRERFSTNIFNISLKRNIPGKVKYGQQYYDFDKGTMIFIGPGQVHNIEIAETERSESAGEGYALMFHPDFILNHPLATNIKKYGFFSYALNEALHLSEKEETYIIEIFQKINQEYQHIDQHTQNIILSQIDLLLNYCNRFYQRQFITRKAVNSDLLIKIETILDNYFNSNTGLNHGTPTVEYLADKVNLSPHYLTDMLRSLTGKGTKSHIQDHLIAAAKAKLLSTDLSIAEIAFELGFEYPQSFNKLFKKKMNMSPNAFRQKMN